jgi:hypothetical protein
VHDAFCIDAFLEKVLGIYVGAPFDELGTRGKKQRFRLGLTWRVPRLKHNQESWR